INDDANYNSTLTTALATKLPLAGGTMTGDIFINGGSTTERNVCIQNTGNVLYAGVEGSSGNRFVGSSTGNAFFGTTSDSGLEFATHNNVRMIVDGDGNVGIGTATPGAKLEISGFSTGAGLKLNYGNSSGTIEAVNFKANGGANGVIGMQMVSAGVGDLWLGGSGGRSLTLYRNGNIGIGTDTPSNKLHVHHATAALGFDQAIRVSTNSGNYTGGRGGGILMQ
ncbi:MAG: hypothetical protein ACKVJK_23420, partial [Methylophagaceae bacterium]